MSKKILGTSNRMIRWSRTVSTGLFLHYIVETVGGYAPEGVEMVKERVRSVKKAGKLMNSCETCTM